MLTVASSASFVWVSNYWTSDWVVKNRPVTYSVKTKSYIWSNWNICFCMFVRSRRARPGYRSCLERYDHREFSSSSRLFTCLLYLTMGIMNWKSGWCKDSKLLMKSQQITKTMESLPISSLIIWSFKFWSWVLVSTQITPESNSAWSSGISYAYVLVQITT